MMNPKNVKIVGSAILLLCIGFWVVWYPIAPETWWGDDFAFYVNLSSGIIALTAIELLIWIRVKGTRALQFMLKASAILMPFMFSCFGMFIGSIFCRGCDTNLSIIFWGMGIGFVLGTLFSVYIFAVISMLKNQSKETPPLQNKGVYP